MQAIKRFYFRLQYIE